MKPTVLAISCLLASVPTPSLAAYYLVTSLADSGPGTLREASTRAKDGDHIRFLVDGVIELKSRIVIDKGLAIEGPGQDRLAIDGGGSTLLFEIIGQEHQVSFSCLTLQNGKILDHTQEGGAIYFHGLGNRLEIDHVKFSHNAAGIKGGAISSDTIGERGVFYLEVDIRDSTFEDNQTVQPIIGTGGAIYSALTLLKISGTTFNGNHADSGGAIEQFRGRIDLLNSTLYQNHADSIGGALNWTDSESTADLAFDTITGNSAGEMGGGLNVSSFMPIHLISNVIAANLSPDAPDIAADKVLSLGSNVIGEGFGIPGWISTDLYGSPGNLVDPELGPLANNGGPTQTELPLAGSPVVGFVQWCVDWNGNPVTRDQRGFPRPQPPGGRCDSGSVERK